MEDKINSSVKLFWYKIHKDNWAVGAIIHAAVSSKKLPDPSNNCRVILSLPLRFFFEKPVHNLQVTMHVLGSMDLFFDLAAVMKRLRKIGPKALHPV
jgi:hypothetical protein